MEIYVTHAKTMCKTVSLPPWTVEFNRDPGEEHVLHAPISKRFETLGRRIKLSWLIERPRLMS